MRAKEAAIGVQRVHRYTSVAAVVAAAGFTTIGTFLVPGCANAYFDITVAVAALTGFAVQFRATPTGAFKAVALVAADYTNPDPPILWADVSLVTAAVGNHNLLVDVRGVESVRILAASAASNATVALEVGAD